MVIELDASSIPPKGVTTPSYFSVFVGYTPRQLLFFSGMAECNWTSDGDLDREDVIVRLGVSTTPYFQLTVTTALSSITDENSDFTFATDSAVVETAPDGTLQLRVRVAAQGDSGTVHAFSYSAQVLSDPVSSKVMGLISWSRSWGDPAQSVQVGGQPMFRIAVGQTVSTPPAFPGGFGGVAFTETAVGYSGVPALSGDTWVAPYEIDGIAFGPTWEVRPALLPQTFTGPPAGYAPNAQFSPQQQVTLTPFVPSAVGVDFVMDFGHAPK